LSGLGGMTVFGVGGGERFARSANAHLSAIKLREDGAPDCGWEEVSVEKRVLFGLAGSCSV
jgi:hypothetical protein